MENLYLTPNHRKILEAAARGGVKRVGARDLWGNRGVTPNVTEMAAAGLLHRPDGDQWIPTAAGITALNAGRP